MAAEKGNAEAQYFLGNIYDFGDGQNRSLAKAAEWYRKAADQGYAPAQRSLTSVESEIAYAANSPGLFHTVVSGATQVLDARNQQLQKSNEEWAEKKKIEDAVENALRNDRIYHPQR